MGVARAMVKLLMREGLKEPFKGSIITAGRQDVFATLKDLYKWANEMNFPLSCKAQREIGHKGKIDKNMRIDDKILFRLLGFSEIASIDSSDFEKCSIVRDLNKDMPAELHGRFDVVFDGGTSEHIFDFPKVLENYNKLLKVGGRVIHASPTSNFVDHGFYMFSPTVFYDYYSANRWEIVETLFIKHSYRHDKRLWDIYGYAPGCLSRHSYGGLNKGLYATFFVARKKLDSTFDASVQQGYYLNLWSKKVKEGRALRIFRALPPALREFIHYFMTSIVPLRFFLKRVARY